VLFLAIAASELRAQPPGGSRAPVTTQSTLAIPSAIHEDVTTGTLSRTTDGFTARPGYVGPDFLGTASGRAVVLTDSVRTTASSNWAAAGLIRNETLGIIRNPQVTAHLFDGGHHELATAHASVPLVAIRTGEPAPFDIQSDLASSLVASVEWTVSYGATGRIAAQSSPTAEVASSDDAQRAIQFSVFWKRPYGHADRMYGYPQNDFARGPYPYVVFGEIHNSGTQTLLAGRVLAAWLDAKGGVLNVDWLTILPSDQDAKPQSSATLQPDGYADFIYRNSDASIAPRLNDARIVLWGVDNVQ
jgi:hypothetical protein